MRERLFCVIGLCLAMACAGAEPSGADAARLMAGGKTAEAIGIFEGLAAKGDDRAMVELGICYYEGGAVAQDYGKAMDWWLKALAKQNADAFVNLGVMHRDGCGVPKNAKIAYCVFLTTHMCGLGTESTQTRANRCLRGSMAALAKEDVKDCLTNYTLGYVVAYLEARGKMEGIPETHRATEKNPAFRDLDWWLDGELDALCGPPTEEERKAREERDERRRTELEALRHILVVQVRFAGESARKYRSCGMVTDMGMESHPVRPEDLQSIAGASVHEQRIVIFADERRYATVTDAQGTTFLFKIDHPVRPSPCDWCQWRKPTRVSGPDGDVLAASAESEAAGKADALPDDAPELRFKVIKP